MNIRKQNLELRSQLEGSKKQENKWKENEILISSLREQIDQYKSLERRYTSKIREAELIKYVSPKGSNNISRDQVKNSEILKEEIRALQIKLERAEALQPKYNELLIQMQDMEKEQRRW